MLTFVEVLTGSIHDATHVGKMLVYLRDLLELHPDRDAGYGVLTNLMYAVLYYKERGDDNWHCSQPLDMAQGMSRWRGTHGDIHALYLLCQCTACTQHSCHTVKHDLLLHCSACAECNAAILMSLCSAMSACAVEETASYAGGYNLLINLIKASQEDLRYKPLRFNLSEPFSPFEMLSKGRHSTVYMALNDEREPCAVKVRMTSLGSNRLDMTC